MARILNNFSGKKTIVLSTDDILTLVKAYQEITKGAKSYDEIRNLLNTHSLYLPEEIV